MIRVPVVAFRSCLGWAELKLLTGSTCQLCLQNAGVTDDLK